MLKQGSLAAAVAGDGAAMALGAAAAAAAGWMLLDEAGAAAAADGQAMRLQDGSIPTAAAVAGSAPAGSSSNSQHQRNTQVSCDGDHACFCC